jgi:hypothetical protein
MEVTQHAEHKMSTKSARKVLSTVVNSLIAVNAYVATLAAQGQAPLWLIPVFAGLAIIAQIVKDEYVATEIKKNGLL